MKNLFLTLVFSCFSIFTFANEQITLPKSKVDVTIMSESGCKVHIKGIVSYSLFPPEITGFTGTVTISGGDCESTTLTFRQGSANKKSDLTLQFDTTNVEKMKMIKWEGKEASHVKILNEKKINEKVVSALKKACS